MTLTTEERREAAAIFKRTWYLADPTRPAYFDRDDVFSMLDALDAAIDAVPANAAQSIGQNLFNSLAEITQAPAGQRQDIAARLMSAVLTVRAER